MKTIWALAGALCLAVRFAQAAPTADVVQDVGNGVNQISEKSAEVPIVSSEVEVDVATPILVSRVSTILTAATPAIYQDAAKNPNELSERIVKPVTLLLNSVSGGVTTLAKDNSRRFFVPSFVRFNFRQDALLELDRIRQTERFWNETEQYVDSVCARLKKYIEIQRRRGSQGAPAPTSATTTTPTAVPPSASTATALPARPFSTAVHVAVKSDLKLSIHEPAEPIKIPTVDLPGKRNPLRPVHPVLKPRPTSEPHATVQVAPLKEPAAEVLAPKPIKAIESLESTSAAPSEVPVGTTSVPSKVEPSPTSTPRVPEITTTTTETRDVVTSEATGSVAITEQSTPVPDVPKIPSVVDVKVPEESSFGLVAAESVPVETIVAPAVQSKTAAAYVSEPAAVATSRTESSPEPIPAVEPKTPEVPQGDSGTFANARSVAAPKPVPEEDASPVANVPAESPVVAASQPETSPEVVKTAEVPETSVPVSSGVVVPVDAKSVEKTSVVAPTSTTPSVETTSAQLPVVDVVAPVAKTVPPVVPTTEVPSTTQPEVSEPVVVPAVETVSHAAPEVVSPTTSVPEVVETSSVSTVAPVVQGSTSAPKSTLVSSVPKPVPETVPAPVQPEHVAAESSVVPVAVQTPFPETFAPSETAVKTESVVTTSTESAVHAAPAVSTAKPVEESHTTVPQEVTTVQQIAVTTTKPGGVHRVHPVPSSIVFPSKAPAEISQSVNVSQFGVSSSASPEHPLSFVSSTTVTTSRSDSSRSTIEALRFEQVALSHPIVIRPVKSPLPIAIPHRVIKHSPDGVSVVKTQSTGPIGGQVEKSSR